MNKSVHCRIPVRRQRYTLIEVLASMGIFLILMMVLMQFFSAAKTLWMTSSRRNELYANARVALDLISRDVENAMYMNDNTTRGIYPFWFRERVHISSNNPQVNELNFIASTDLKPPNATSNICEIRYTFVSSAGPLLRDTNNKVIPEGWLVRSCVGDNDTSGRYNFADYAFPTADAGRMLDIWSDNDRYTPVIPGVVQLDIDCYSDVDHTFPPMLDSELNDMVQVSENGVTHHYPKGRLGTMFPQVITIRIKIMDMDNWQKYMKYRRQWDDLATSGKIEAAEKIAAEIEGMLKKCLRTFSRTIYLSKRSSM